MFPKLVKARTTAFGRVNFMASFMPWIVAAPAFIIGTGNFYFFFAYFPLMALLLSKRLIGEYLNLIWYRFYLIIHFGWSTVFGISLLTMPEKIKPMIVIIAVLLIIIIHIYFSKFWSPLFNKAISDGEKNK